MTASCLVTRYRTPLIVAHLTVASQRGLHPACMKHISDPRTQADCPTEALTWLQMEKRLVPLPPHNQSQPHRTFLVHQNLRRPLLPRQPPRRRIGLPQRRTTSRPSLTDDRTRRRRKTPKPRSNRLQSQLLLSLLKQLRYFFT